VQVPRQLLIDCPNTTSVTQMPVLQACIGEHWAVQ
jgi:hypothetical protein